MAGVPASSRGGSSSAGVTELSYVEYTSSVSISATTAATANTIVTAAAITVDGLTRLCIELLSPLVTIGNSATAQVYIGIYDGSTQLGVVANYSSQAADFGGSPCYVRFHVTPAAATKTYSWRGYRAVVDGAVGAGAGGPGDVNLSPGYIRVTSGS